jgi:hypothetical protein
MALSGLLRRGDIQGIRSLPSTALECSNGPSSILCRCCCRRRFRRRAVAGDRPDPGPRQRVHRSARQAQCRARVAGHDADQQGQARRRSPEGGQGTADEVSATLAKLKPPAGKEAQFKELVDNWNAFKKTRENDLVPAILAGKDDEARKIAGGIQKERITKCQQLVGELGG